MKRERWNELGPSLLVAFGMIASSLVAVTANGSVWRALAACVVLALATVAAGIVSRRPGESFHRTISAAVAAAAIVIAGTLVAFRDPKLVTLLLPVLGVSAWAPLLRPSAGRTGICRYL